MWHLETQEMWTLSLVQLGLPEVAPPSFGPFSYWPGPFGGKTLSEGVPYSLPGPSDKSSALGPTEIKDTITS